MWVDRESWVGIRGEALYAGGYLLPQHTACGGHQSPGLSTVDRVGHELQSVETANINILDSNLARF